MTWDPSGAFHLLAGQGEGAQRVASFAKDGAPGPLKLLQSDSTPDLLKQLRQALEAAHMGLRLYLAGTEGFLWQAVKMAREFGLAADEWKAERCGSLERPVYCTHCKAITQGVKTSLFTCPSCGRSLFVRDHFSRHLAAYMGVQVDAEVPGDVPQAEVLYP
jgi:predicted RNA-binding Zn-ribbon protein involved in translation (DUF1610 family)